MAGSLDSGAGRRPQPAAIRLAHWSNVPILVFMAASGLQIFDAYPAFGPRDHPYRWFPLQQWEPPEWLRFGGWLAGARHMHLALGWLLVFEGLLYLGYLAASGEWRRRESALHPQTILAYGMNGAPLRPDHGAPLRLLSGVKLGYKMVKYLTAVRFLPMRTGGCCEDQGCEWFAGV